MQPAQFIPAPAIEPEEREVISGGVERHSEREWVIENDKVDREKVVLRLRIILQT